MIKRLLSILSAACLPVTLVAQTVCTGGFAGTYPCLDIDLDAFMTPQQVGGADGTDLNDIWGWTDPVTGTEWALVGRTDGTAFVDLSDPINPVYVGNLPTATFSSSWRDIKVHADHAYIVADNAGAHGMQVFDLTQLRSVAVPPVTFSSTTTYTEINSAHNVAVNEQSGVGIITGASGGGVQQCAGGLHFVDLSTPASPSFAGCFSSDGYTHDAQCVTYTGPDTDHSGKEICIASNTDTITIVDATNKSAAVQLARVGYPLVGYVHQGWFSEDQNYFFQNDESDESSLGINTSTYIWDVTDLDAPILEETYVATTAAIDHNLYVKGNYMYQSNYRAGLRVLDVSSPLNPVEVGYFDTYPDNDLRSFTGSWSNYPYFDSGIVIVSSIEEGLFVVRPRIGILPVELVSFEAQSSARTVRFLWEIASEDGHLSFDIEERIGESMFETVASTTSEAGTVVPNRYEAELQNVNPGRHAFRLKLTDADGTASYSELVEVFVNTPSTHYLSQVYPNPFRDRATMRLVVQSAQHLRVSLVDVTGRELTVFFDGLVSDSDEILLDIDGLSLAHGTYFVNTVGEAFRDSKAVIIGR